MSEFKVTRYKLRTQEEGHRGTDDPFSAVFLSDLHNCSYGEGNSALLQEIRNQSPEAVFVSGDMLTGTVPPETDAAASLLDELTKKYPVYYVNGNHEQRMRQFPDRYEDSYQKYSDTIKSFGVHLLENACERIEIRRMPITVWGYELPMEYYRRTRSAELLPAQLHEALGEPDPASYNLLLTHNPMHFSAYAAWGADLTLAGHLHGGIIRLPFFGGLISPQMRLFPNYTRGLYQINKKKMIVSAGLGSHTVSMRINNPPELVVIDFV